MKLWQKIKAWCAWRPPTIGSTEGLLLRLGLAAVIWFAFFNVDPSYTRQPHPNGFAEYIDFTFLADPSTWDTLKLIAAAALVAYVCGWVVPLSLGYILLLMIAYGTLRNSQGNIHHGSQALTTVVLGQWIAYLIVAIRDNQRAWYSLFKNVGAHSKSYFYSQQAVVAGYVCAGIAKIGKGKPSWSLGWHWVDQIPNMSVMVTRNGVQNSYSEADGRALMEHGERMGRLIAENPLLAKLLIAPGLYMELLIVFALCNRRLAVWIGLALLVMHWLIAYIMQLRFPLNELVIALFFINVTFLILAAIEKLSGGRWRLLETDPLPSQ
jgi:hypothetical protein